MQRMAELQYLEVYFCLYSQELLFKKRVLACVIGRPQHNCAICRGLRHSIDIQAYPQVGKGIN
ncbi:hypothetical protein Plhal304r1_c016g0059391 [Plasmopara halstedii]